MAKTILVSDLKLRVLEKLNMENSSFASSAAGGELEALINDAAQEWYTITNDSDWGWNRLTQTGTATSSISITNCQNVLQVFYSAANGKPLEIRPLNPSDRTFLETNTDSLNYTVDYLPVFTDLASGGSFTYYGDGDQYVINKVAAHIRTKERGDPTFFLGVAARCEANAKKTAKRELGGDDFPDDRYNDSYSYDIRKYFYRLNGPDTIQLFRTRYYPL